MIKLFLPTFLLAGLVAPLTPAELSRVPIQNHTYLSTVKEAKPILQMIIDDQQAILDKQEARSEKINKRIKELRKYVGKTEYMFSGSTPSGWDCSGLVVWFYEGLGKELPHSATKQGWIKPKVEDPMPGDIVVFRNQGYTNFNHSAIYIGNNKAIHSGFGDGDRTEIISLDNRPNTEIKFVRIIEVPNE